MSYELPQEYGTFSVCVNYQMMMSYFKDTADAVAEYCTAVSCPNASTLIRAP